MIEILADWPLTTIGAEFDIQQGKSLSPSARLGEKPRPFLRTSNVYWGRVDLAVVDQMDFTEEEFRRLSLVDGDLLVCEGGDIGRSAVYRGPSGRYAYQNHLHRLRPKNDEIVPEFVAHWLRAAFTQLGIYEGVGNRTTIPNLSRARLSQLPIPKPEPTEQRQIALILNSVQKAIETESAICDKLAALKSATMAKLFREGLRGEPLKQTEIGEIPESWDVVRLGDIARITTGTTPSTDEPEYYVGDIPFVKTAEIDGQVITTSAVKVSQRAVHDYGLKLYPPGTVLLAMYGQGKTRGRTALLGVTAATTQNTAAIECLERLIPTYLWYWLDSRYEDLRGMGNLGHLSHLNLGYVKHLLVPLPDLTEQEEIANSVDLIRKRLEVAKGKRNLLAELFRIMLHSLMTGAIRVKDLDLAEVSHA
jgi:type I restriction enzyme S subunit